jgi:hypothetical protein
MDRLPAAAPFAALLAVLLLLPAASQTPAERIARAVDIPVEEWTAMAAGRTLTYRIDGDLWALEHYTPGTNRVQIELYDGTCMTGTWDYSAPHYCFHWDGQGTSCFRHARLGDEVLVIEASDGQDTPMTQSMTGVSDTPLSCGPAGIS